MITEKNVTWTCRSCLQFEKCLRRRIHDDKTCEWFRPDQQYIDNELRRLNAIEQDKLQRDRAVELGAKPCPFCGKDAAVVLRDSFLDSTPVYCVSCKDDACRGFKQPDGGDPDNEVDAVEQWNRRAK